MMTAHDDSSASKPSIAVQRQYYDGFWAKGVKPLSEHNLSRLSHIFDAIRTIAIRSGKHHFGSICDLGCGVGWLANYLSTFGPVTGVDLSPEGVNQAAAKYPHIAFEAHDILSWRPKQRFELVVSSEVLEHIEDKQKVRFVETLAAITEPGGYVIITTPNKSAAKAWNASRKSGMTGQAIEDWISPRALRQVLSPHFSPVKQKIFHPDFSFHGVYRVLSAPKVRRAMGFLGVEEIYDATRLAGGFGLYQIAIAQRRE